MQGEDCVPTFSQASEERVLPEDGTVSELSEVQPFIIPEVLAGIVKLLRLRLDSLEQPLNIYAILVTFAVLKLLRLRLVRLLQ